MRLDFTIKNTAHKMKAVKKITNDRFKKNVAIIFWLCFKLPLVCLDDRFFLLLWSVRDWCVVWVKVSSELINGLSSTSIYYSIENQNFARSLCGLGASHQHIRNHARRHRASEWVVFAIVSYSIEREISSVAAGAKVLFARHTNNTSISACV